MLIHWPMSLLFRCPCTTCPVSFTSPCPSCINPSTPPPTTLPPRYSTVSAQSRSVLNSPGTEYRHRNAFPSTILTPPIHFFLPHPLSFLAQKTKPRAPPGSFDDSSVVVDDEDREMPNYPLILDPSSHQALVAQVGALQRATAVLIREMGVVTDSVSQWGLWQWNGNHKEGYQ